MKRMWYIVFGALIVLLLIILLIMSILIIHDLRSIRIMDHFQVGLSPLMNEEIIEMFVSQGSNPDLQGTFSDEHFAEKVRELLKNGCYQPCSEVKSDNAPGSNSHPYLRFTTEDHVVVIVVMQEKMKISIDGSSEYYYSNIWTELKIMIDDVLAEYFAK